MNCLENNSFWKKKSVEGNLEQKNQDQWQENKNYQGSTEIRQKRINFEFFIEKQEE